MIRVGIDIGGTKVNIGLLSENRKILAKKMFPVGDASDPVAFVSVLHEAVRTLCVEAQIDESSVGFCGIGVPGTVSDDKMSVLCAPNLGWTNIPIGRLFAERTGYTVRMVQDAKAAAWGEYCAGSGKGQDLLCVTLGTGIGTGILIDGRLYRGALGTAGEIGHTPVVGNGRECGCGKQGCLEKYAAGGGLDISAKERFGADSTARDLFSAAKNGDSDSAGVIADAIEMLGSAIVGAVNLLSPDCVLFSGGLSEEDAYLTPLISYIRAHVYSAGGFPVIRKAALGALAPLYGAALFDPSRF